MGAGSHESQGGVEASSSPFREGEAGPSEKRSPEYAEVWTFGLSLVCKDLRKLPRLGL